MIIFLIEIAETQDLVQKIATKFDVKEHNIACVELSHTQTMDTGIFLKNVIQPCHGYLIAYDEMQLPQILPFVIRDITFFSRRSPALLLLRKNNNTKQYSIEHISKGEM